MPLIQRRAVLCYALLFTAALLAGGALRAGAANPAGARVFYAPGPPPPPEELRAGFAARSLVSKIPGLPLGGYGDRQGAPSEGVHDPCFVKAMCLSNGGDPICLVTFDLIGICYTVRDDVIRKLPPDFAVKPANLLFCASHTHAGYGALAKPVRAPALNLLFGATMGRFNPDLYEEVARKTADCIVEACGALAPARLGVGVAEETRLSANRGLDGGPIDPQVTVIKVEDLQGNLKGLFTNFTAHPTVLSGKNMLLSAEWPGAFQRALEAKYNGKITALFSNGAEGDVRPTGQRDGWEKIDWIGATLADKVNAMLPGIKTSRAVPLRSTIGVAQMPRGLKALVGARESYFQWLVIGDAMLMAIPGEPCAQIGLDLKARARKEGWAVPVIIGLANDHLGYFVHPANYTRESAASHQYEKGLNFYGAGVGARFEQILFDELHAAAPPAPAPAKPGASEEF